MTWQVALLPTDKSSHLAYTGVVKQRPDAQCRQDERPQQTNAKNQSERREGSSPELQPARRPEQGNPKRQPHRKVYGATTVPLGRVPGVGGPHLL